MLKRRLHSPGDVFIACATLLIAGTACKRDKSEAPAPDPLAPPTQSAPSTTEIAPETHATDTPPPPASATAAPAKTTTSTGTGTGSGSGKTTKKEDGEKKEEKKSEGNKSCFTECQNAFQACLTPSIGSTGLPQPPPMDKCNQVLQGCQNACK
jgi:hypothetical protein